MSQKNPFSFGWGILIAPFLVFGIFVLFAPSVPSENAIVAYQKDSKEMILPVSKPVYQKGGSWAEHLVKGDDAKFYHTVRYYLNFKHNRYKSYAVFYSNEYSKYFVIESYDNTLQNLLNYELVKDLPCMVNQQELTDAAYGSLKQPVPILWITKGYDLTDPANARLYKQNVGEYLRFYKNRKTFDKGACAVCAY
ncbi:hypothetical protein INP83_00300 [Mucilaginibacter sp. 21P]|uniref:hypothetical protein n=1 Tax=Mucilaginibacter sp. 21P TaxID=2778902 RepID=UPI001C584BF0|nr:hypothetical protein [Mucilaginibacter sp. 21P]QXV65577.1 hypothetical protein INP83_00300 [Mucilaginibacter sp. 21P]